MFVQDKIADMLTRIRNANVLRYDEVVVFGTKINIGIAKILKEEGYINDFKKLDDGMLQLILKYSGNERVIVGLKRISKSGLRVYAKANELPTVLNGMGIAIISTSEGLMTDKLARDKKLGGEVLAYIW